jgi:hypothetical protein
MTNLTIERTKIASKIGQIVWQASREDGLSSVGMGLRLTQGTLQNENFEGETITRPVGHEPTIAWLEVRRLIH